MVSWIGKNLMKKVEESRTTGSHTLRQRPGVDWSGEGLSGGGLGEKAPGASFVTTAFAWRQSFLHRCLMPVWSSLQLRSGLGQTSC